MTDIKITSNSNRKLKPLVKAALANELRLLEAGQRQSERRINEFEKKYRISTQKFISRYENDEFDETLDFAEWIGEFKMLERLREKADTLRDIKFAN